MGREKNKRNLIYKPAFKDFIPENKPNTGITVLLDEEMEALYLMDVLNLYQEEAAKSMEVSRPTFTRVLKNARQKLTRALVYGNKISIQDDDLGYIVALCSSKKDTFESILATDQFILIYKVKDDEVELLEILENDVFTKKRKPAIVLPEVLMKYKVNIFLATRIGEGLKNSLFAKGIQAIEKRIDKKEDLITLLNS